MARQRNPNKYYFTQDTEDAIVKYNLTSDELDRNRIYNEHIRDAFDKLVENMIHTFKFYNFDVPYEDVKNEVIAFLNEKIHKFTAGKGKAFSYFSIVAKNYLIIHNNASYYKTRDKEDPEVVDDYRNVVNEVVYSDFQEILKEFMDLFVDYYDRNLANIFTNKKDLIVADSVLELFRIRENIEDFNKKALYILVRERTGLKTQNITRVVNKMRDDFGAMFLTYQRTGIFKTV
jgi:hypothetical protein